MSRDNKQQKTKEEFTTEKASRKLISAMEDAIGYMTDEISKEPDQGLSGSQRKSELQTYKETALACKELIVERQRLLQYIKDLAESVDGTVDEKNDWGGGFSERFAKH